MGNVALLGTLVLLFLVPEIAGDPLPPEISFSQFGLGPNGWLFSLWVLLLPTAALLFWSVAPRRPRAALILLGIGAFGCLVMAIVRTDAGGLQASGNAQIHTAASVLALFGVPYGSFVLLWTHGRVWRGVGLALAAAHTVGIALLLLAATGLDTAGLGPSRSWAFWQFIAVLADHGLVLALAVATNVALRSDRRPAASIQ